MTHFARSIQLGILIVLGGTLLPAEERRDPAARWVAPPGILFAPAALAQLNPARPFTVRLSSVGSPFAIQSQFEGQCRLDAVGLIFEVKQGTIQLRPGMLPRRLVSLRVGLARPRGEAWEPAVWSEPLEIDRDMKPGERVTIAAHTFSIPLDPSVDLATHWLIVQHQEVLEDGASSSYVHSARNVFAPVEVTTVPDSTPFSCNPAVTADRRRVAVVGGAAPCAAGEGDRDAACRGRTEYRAVDRLILRFGS